MPFEKKELDLEALKAAQAEGLTYRAIGERFGVSDTLIRRRLNDGKNGAKPAPPKRERASAPTNGHAKQPANGHSVKTEDDELGHLLDGWWQKLPVLERVRLLLARVPQ